MIAIALVLLGELALAAGVPYDVEALVKRADACSSVWGSKTASNSKFMSIEIQEKNEEILTKHRCSTLAANVISTCLKYDVDPHLKQICAHLLVQTADATTAAPAPPAVQPVQTVLPAQVNRPVIPPINSPKTPVVMPASGMAPPTASGAALAAPANAQSYTPTAETPDVAVPAPPTSDDLSPPAPMREPAGPATSGAAMSPPTMSNSAMPTSMSPPGMPNMTAPTPTIQNSAVPDSTIPIPAVPIAAPPLPSPSPTDTSPNP